MVKRGEGKNNTDVKNIDFYNFYLQNYCNDTKIMRKSKNYVDISKFRKIISMFNQLMMEEIIFKSYEYKIPLKNRNFRIGIRKAKALNTIDKETNKLKVKTPVDWKATNDLWKEDEEAKKNKKLIRFTNEHTNEFICKFTFIKKDSKNIANFYYYNFDAARCYKRMLAKALKDKNLNLDYYLF